MPNPFRLHSKSFIKVILVLISAGLMSACGSVATMGAHTGEQQAALANSSAQVSGFVVGEDNATPVFGATVALLSEQNSTDQSGSALNDCPAPSKQFINYTCTREDGSFALDLSNVGEFPITVSVEQSGQHHEITVTRDKLNQDLGAIVLSEISAGHKDKVAVVMDFYNPIEQIQEFLQDNPSQLQSVKLQLMNEYQSLYEISDDSHDISYPTFYSLFIDEDKDGEADIFKYDVVYLNSRKQSDIAQLDQSLRKQLLKFINNGGELIVTEWTVELQREEATPDQYI